MTDNYYISNKKGKKILKVKGKQPFDDHEPREVKLVDVHVIEPNKEGRRGYFQADMLLILDFLLYPHLNNKESHQSSEYAHNYSL